MLKEILNELIYTNMLVRLWFPSIILSNWLLSEAIFDHSLFFFFKVWTSVLDRISFSICLLFPGFTLEPEQIKKILSVRYFREAGGKIQD